MRIYGMRFTLIAFLLVPTLALTLATWNGSANQDVNPQAQQKRLTKATADIKPTLEKQLAEMPVVDFEHAEQEAAFNPFREAKNRRHNSPTFAQGIKLPELNENGEPVLLDLPVTHGPTEPAIPVASNVIVIGSIVDVEAYLSSDKTTLYTEATIKIEQALKGEVRYGLIPGTRLTAERTGGAVRFSSGKILRRATFGKNIPAKGHRYLLFLNEVNDSQSFSIVTAYKLQNDTVFPLDGIGGSDGGFPQFAAYKTYKNAAESTLIDDVRKAIAEQSSARKGR